MEFTTHLELHSQTTRLVEGVSHGRGHRSHTGFSPSTTSCSKELRPGPRPKRPLQITTRAPGGPDFKFELLPLHSPLLRQSLLVSFPPLIDMLKFSGYPYLIRGQPENGREPGFTARNPRTRQREFAQRLETDARPETLGRAPKRGAQYQARLEWCNDARTGMPFGMPKGAMCVQRFDDSLNSAIHITYRISLRSSSMPEPRDPLLKVLMGFAFPAEGAPTRGSGTRFGSGLTAGGGGTRPGRGAPRAEATGRVGHGVLGGGAPGRGPALVR